MGGGAV
jgi:hypothetical protein